MFDELVYILYIELNRHIKMNFKRKYSFQLVEKCIVSTYIYMIRKLV